VKQLAVLAYRCACGSTDCVTGRPREQHFELRNKTVDMRGDSGANGDDDNAIAGAATFWKITVVIAAPLECP
jgi:hypothetical protein